MSNASEKIGLFFCRIGVSANVVTALGLMLAALSGYLIYHGYFTAAAVSLLVSGLLDLLDGAIARASENVSKFGAILDSSFDRYGDGFIFTGIIFYCFQHGRHGYAALAISGLIGSFLISYVRARAECLVEKCRVGFWERGERIGLIFVGLLLNNLPLVLWVLGIAAHFTVFFRMYYSYLSSRSDAGWIEGKGLIKNLLFHTSPRRSLIYLAKAGTVFLATLFCRPPF